MIVIINIFKFRKWFNYGMKSKHPIASRPEWQKLLAQDCYGHKLHALKGQKLLAKDYHGLKQHALNGRSS